MRINGYGIILASCLFATVALAHDYETWEQAIRNSDLTFFSRMSKDETINQADLQGLLVLADEVIKQKEEDIYNRKCRVYGSIVLKAGVFPIIGYILDQRALGAVIGLYSLLLGTLGTLMATSALAQNGRTGLAAASAIIGFVATAAAITGCVSLERGFWVKERHSYEKLEKARQNAVAIKARLTAIAAK